jgi:hypothetical protein
MSTTMIIVWPRFNIDHEGRAVVKNDVLSLSHSKIARAPRQCQQKVVFDVTMRPIGNQVGQGFGRTASERPDQT